MIFRKEKIRVYKGTEGQLLVNLGCGPVQPPGWINVDYSNRARLARYFPKVDHFLTKLGLIPPTEFTIHTTVFDVRKPLPFVNSSVRAFYAGELWEHLLPQEAESLMRECFRALAPGGHLRVNVPDNYEFWKRYCDAHEEMIKKPRELWDDEYSKNYVRMFWEDICTSRPILGSMGHFHKWGYDEVSLVLQCERAGFLKVARRNLYASDIPDIGAVEKNAFLVVEGTKPVNR